MKNLNVLTTEERLSLTLAELFDSFGYGRYRMSKFEEYSLYLENKNFLSSENIITFNDMDGKLLALKPDVTLSIVKNVGAKFAGIKKLYYNENVYRLDKSTGKYREINQMGLEAIGKLDVYTMLEVISLALQSLSDIDKAFVLDISNISFVTGLIDSLSFPQKDGKSKIMECIANKNVDGLMRLSEEYGFDADTKKRIKTLVTAGGSVEKVLEIAESIAVNTQMKKSVASLKELYYALKETGYDKNIRIDFSIINDTDYYNDIVFQGYVSRVPRAVLSGGRYDKLVEKFNKNAEAVGFAVYMNEVTSYYSELSEYDVDAIVLYDKVCDYANLFNSVNKLRSSGKEVLTLTELPDGIRARVYYKFEDGSLTEVENV